MKYSELKRKNLELERENEALKSLHIEKYTEAPGGARKLRISILGPLLTPSYGDQARRLAAAQFASFLFKEDLVPPRMITNTKTGERSYVFELKVVP